MRSCRFQLCPAPLVKSVLDPPPLMALLLRRWKGRYKGIEFYGLKFDRNLNTWLIGLVVSQVLSCSATVLWTRLSH